jgi:hypothetical protein
MPNAALHTLNTLYNLRVGKRCPENKFIHILFFSLFELHTYTYVDCRGIGPLYKKVRCKRVSLLTNDLESPTPPASSYLKLNSAQCSGA